MFSKNELVTAKDVTRKPHRALIRLDDFKIQVAEGMLEGVITNWNSDVGVRFLLVSYPDQVKEILRSQELLIFQLL